MVDEFRPDNGATRFVPGSVIVFDASTWHGHTANTSPGGRRSLQATFIPRAGRPATDFVGRMLPDTFARLSPTARYIVGFEPAGDALSA